MSPTPGAYDPSVRILIVDDNEINLNVASGLIRILYGLVCDSALSGSEALAMVRETDYDLIFMDHMMPDMDGAETAARIRACGSTRATVPIIALTADAETDARERLLASRMNDFLAKPIRKDELAAVLRRWLPGDKLRDEGAPPSSEDRPGGTAGRKEARAEPPGLMPHNIPEMAEGGGRMPAKTLRRLYSALGQYDYDAVVECLDRLPASNFGPAVNSVVADVKRDIGAFDYDKARERLSAAFGDAFLAEP